MARVFVAPSIQLPENHTLHLWRLGRELGSREFIERLLDKAIEERASCIHLKASSFPAFRLDGVLSPVGDARLEEGEVEQITSSLLELAGLAADPRSMEEEFRLVWGGCHFRVTAYRQSGSLALVIHCILRRGPRLRALGVDEAYAVPAGVEGLYLVGGGGRRELLAALVEHHNQHHNQHIVALRDHPRYLYVEARSMISQIEVGVDCASFLEGLEAACRLAPDWLVLGQIPREAAGAVMERVSARTCMVLAAVPPDDPVEAVRWFCDRCPDPGLARTELAGCLYGVLTLGPDGVQYLDKDRARAIAWRRTPQGFRV